MRDFYDSFIEGIVDKNDYLYTIILVYALFLYNEKNNFKALFMPNLVDSRTINEVLSFSWNIETIESIYE